MDASKKKRSDVSCGLKNKITDRKLSCIKRDLVLVKGLRQALRQALTVLRQTHGGETVQKNINHSWQLKTSQHKPHNNIWGIRYRCLHNAYLRLFLDNEVV